MKKFFLLFTMMLATTMGLLAQGTTWQTATLISNGATKTGTLDSSNGEHWYKINVTTEGTVNLTATATETLTLSTSGSYVAGLENNSTYSRGTFSGSGYGSVTVTYQGTDMGTGTYYIRVCRYNGAGSYSLKYTFTRCSVSNDPEPNNDYEHSSLLVSGTTVQGRLGYRTSDNVTDYDDWYKIVVPEEGHVELVATATATATENLLLSTTSSQVCGFKNNNTYSRGTISASGYGSDTITYLATDMGKGTYYIRINRYNGCGGYKLYYKFTPCPLENDFEPDDDYQHYNRLLNGRATEGRLGYRTSDDVTDYNDWYRIIVPKDGPIDITVTATENLTFSTYSSQIYSVKADGTLGSYEYISGSGYGNAVITYQKDNKAAGIYYIRINRYSGSGGYTITYNGPVSDIPGDVDGDGEVNIGDISDITDYLLNGDPMNPLPNGDADGDGQITIADITAIIDILLSH